MNDPKRTVRLLDELQSLGFSDSVFAYIHHFPNETIERHRNYCLKVGTFQLDGTNELVQKRLELLLRAYRAGGFTSAHEEVFSALAQAAIAEIPPGPAALV